MAAILIYRTALRRNAVPLGLGFASSCLFVAKQRPMHLDAVRAPLIPSTPSDTPRRPRPESDVVKQLSTGSLAGFVVGVLVSVFSRTLVLLAGLAVVALQVASRCGIDLVGRLHLKKLIRSSRVLSALQDNATFKLAFGLAFTLSAFASF